MQLLDEVEGTRAGACGTSCTHVSQAPVSQWGRPLLPRGTGQSSASPASQDVGYRPAGERYRRHEDPGPQLLASKQISQLGAKRGGHRPSCSPDSATLSAALQSLIRQHDGPCLLAWPHFRPSATSFKVCAANLVHGHVKSMYVLCRHTYMCIHIHTCVYTYMVQYLLGLFGSGGAIFPTSARSRAESRSRPRDVLQGIPLCDFGWHLSMQVWQAPPVSASVHAASVVSQADRGPRRTPARSGPGISAPRSFCSVSCRRFMQVP